MKFIIVGAGAVGTSLSRRLVAQQHDVCLIERHENKLSKALANVDLDIIYGNGCSPEVLARAGINTADYVVSVANFDEVNIAVCLVAKLMNEKAKRVARIRDISLVHKEIIPQDLSNYFDLIINPDLAAAEHLLQLFKVAGAKEVVDFCDGRLRVLGITLSENSPYINKKLSELSEIRSKFPILILGIVRANSLLVPRGGDRLLPGDIIYCITEPERTAVLFEMAGRTYSEGRSAIIWGGGVLGRSLAHSLESQGTKVKLIISEQEAELELVDELSSTLILTGEGTDQALLEEENISDSDAFFAVTADEEDNILSALLAKKLGARTSMALVNKAMYLPLVHAIGVDVVVSSRIAAAGAIFSHIHSGSIISECSLRHLGAGFIEVEATSQMPLVDKTLEEAKIPYGILMAAIVRDDQFFIPSGKDAVKVGDRLVIFVTQGAEKKLEKLLNIKLEFFL